MAPALFVIVVRNLQQLQSVTHYINKSINKLMLKGERWMKKEKEAKIQQGMIVKDCKINWSPACYAVRDSGV